MKKIYPSKELSMEEAPIMFQLQRRHTIKEGEVNEENPSQRPPFSRANSTTCMYKSPNVADSSKSFSSASTVVITESELSSSWLYKNKKEQMNNNDESFTKCDPEQMQANKEENTPKVHKTKANSTSMDQGRAKKGTSCFCYTMIILGICFVSLLILAGVAGILWMELFTTSESTNETDTNLKSDSSTLNPMKKVGTPIDGSRSIDDTNGFNLPTNYDQSITLDDLSSGSIVQMFSNQKPNVENSEKEANDVGTDVSTNAPVRELAIPSIISGVTSFFVKNLEPPNSEKDEIKLGNPNQNIMGPIRNLFNMNGSQNLVRPIRNFFNPNDNQNRNPIRNLFNPGPNSPYSKLFELYNNLRNENRENLSSSKNENSDMNDSLHNSESHLENSNSSEDKFDEEFDRHFEDMDDFDADWENSFDIEKDKATRNKPEIPSLKNSGDFENELKETNPDLAVENMDSIDGLINSNEHIEVIKTENKVSELFSEHATQLEKTFKEVDNINKEVDNINKEGNNKSLSDPLSNSNTVKQIQNEDNFGEKDSLVLPDKDFQQIKTFKTSNEVNDDNLPDKIEINVDLKDSLVKNSNNDENNQSIKQVEQLSNKNETDQPVKQSLSENIKEIESLNNIKDDSSKPLSEDSKMSSQSKSVNKVNDDLPFVQLLDQDSKISLASEDTNEIERDNLVNQPGNLFSSNNDPESFPFETIKEVDEMPVQDPDYDPQNSFTFETIKDDDEGFSSMDQLHSLPESKNTKLVVDDQENQSSNKDSGSLEEVQPISLAKPEGIVSDELEVSELDDDAEHNLKNSELNEEFNWGRPIFETAVPAAINFMNLFTRRTGDFKDTDSKLVEPSVAENQFSLSKTLERLETIDENNALPTPRMSTKKPVSKKELSTVQNKKDVSKERHSYLKHLRDLFFDKRT